jgi:hypothetical protein
VIQNHDAAILAAQIRAESANPGFTMRAGAAILHHLRKLGEAPGELLVDLAMLHRSCWTHEARAFGPAFQGLQRAGRIVQVGWTTRRKGHRSGGARVWRVV